MHRRLFTKLWAMLLCLALVLQIPSVISLADEITETETATVEAASEAETEETAVAAESETSTEETIPETETETIVEETAVETASEVLTETAAEEVESEEAMGTVVTETESVTEEQETHRITGFAGLSEDESKYTFSQDDKPTAEELQDYLPKTLSVYLDGSGTPQAIDVSWTGPSDYEDSQYFFYAFTASWDDTLYTLDTDDDVPYVWVEFSSSMLNAPVTDSVNESKVYNYLVSTQGFSKAAALGIMANIEAESDFDPDLSELGGDGYGLLQWSFDRKTELKSYLNKNGYAEDSIEGQLKFMMKELSDSYYKHILTKLKSVANSADGAYEAAYYFCKYFEVPADTEAQSIARGAWARDRYWPLYSGENAAVDQGLSISGYSTPSDTMTVGTPFSIRGLISSETKLTSVTVGVYNTAGTMVIGRSVTPGAISYDLKEVDTLIKFGTLDPGIYRYKVVATDSKGTSTLINKVFTVMASAQTVANGSYSIVVRDNTAYGLHIAGSSSNNKANVRLGKTSVDTNFMVFTLTYKSDGYYVVRNNGSGKYLTVADASSVSGANVYQHSSGTLWQILPDGKGGNYFVPKCAPSCCLYVEGGKAALKQNIQISTSKMAAFQSFRLMAPKTTQKPTISGQSLPSSLTEGKAFSIKGTVKSSTAITSLTVGVYNSVDHMVIGKTVNPNTTSYDLKNIDAQVKFSSIPAGVYVYRITAKNSAGKATLVEHAFTVLSTSRTIKDGTYYIVLKSNKAFGLGIFDSKANYTNVKLRKVASGSAYVKFNVTYQSNGYYRIKNVGSGKYIGIAKQSSKAGSKVRQSAAGTLFQILYDGGAYRLIPKCATDKALKVAGGNIAEKQMLKIYQVRYTAWQRFIFKKASTASNTTKATKATISGQTTPGNMYVGSPFSIRGVISSTTNLTKVTVGVYGSSGANVIGRTVTPNAKTYDLQNVDSLIKFGTLEAGTYTYVVSATNSAGTATLISKQFKVMN